MIKHIGVKRIVVLAILVSVNLVLGASAYLYFVPENKKVTNELSGLKSQIATKRNETYQLEDNYKLIQEQQVDYENLVEAGFFNRQDRLAFRRRMADIRAYTKVLRASFDISPAQIEDNAAAKKAKHSILKSPVSVNIEAMDDIELYHFIFWLENGFPGHTQITSLSIKRDKDVDEKVLREIGTGNTIVLVSGKVKFDWRTMVPENQLSGDFNAFAEDF